MDKENTMNDPYTPVNAAAASSPRDFIGCCSRYRACSDAGKCLIPEADYAQGCAYRKNLEAGSILYGRRSVYFDEALFQEYQRRAETLDSAHTAALASLLQYFFDVKRGASEALLYWAPEYVLLAEHGFFQVETSPGKIGPAVTRRCNVKALKEASRGTSEAAAAWVSGYRAEKGKPSNKPILREELELWVLHHDRDALNELCSGLAVITLAPFPASFTLEEWYYSQPFSPSTLLAPDSDPRFLKQKG